MSHRISKEFPLAGTNPPEPDSIFREADLIKDFLEDSLEMEPLLTEDVRYWFVAVPVLIAFIAILGIGAWIGWTMATTPPPKPIEEIEAEEKKEEEKKE